MIVTTGRRQALTMWKTSLGERATYRALIEVFVNAGYPAYADNVCSLFKTVEPSTEGPGCAWVWSKCKILTYVFYMHSW